MNKIASGPDVDTVAVAAEFKLEDITGVDDVG